MGIFINDNGDAPTWLVRDSSEAPKMPYLKRRPLPLHEILRKG